MHNLKIKRLIRVHEILKGKSQDIKTIDPEDTQIIWEIPVQNRRNKCYVKYNKILRYKKNINKEKIWR